MVANSKNWRRVFLSLLLVKIVYLGGVYLAVSFWPDLDEEKYFEVMRHWPLEGGPVFPDSHFGTWDAAHYLYLSTRGYTKGTNSCAFYPLWPLAMRGGSIFTDGSDLIAGMVLANLFSLAAWILFHRVVSARFGETVALWALVFLILFPGSLFYQFIYSEPLFVLLVMVLWLGLERDRFGLAWAAAFLLPLSRPVGVFSELPIAWHLLTYKSLRSLVWFEKCASENAKEEQRVNNQVDAENNWRSYGLLTAPLLGWSVYFALMWSWTGNPLEGIQAQKNWGTHAISHLWNLPRFIVGFFEPTTWHDYAGSVLDRCAFMLLVYSLPLIWRLGKDMVLWTYVLGILPAIISPSLTLPVLDGEPALGTWQSLVLVDTNGDNPRRQVRLSFVPA